MIHPDVEIFAGMVLRTSSDWTVVVDDVTENGIVQWHFPNQRIVYGAPVDWVHRSWRI